MGKRIRDYLEEVVTHSIGSHSKRFYRGGYFLIAWEWWRRAVQLPGRASAVALVVWREVNMRRSYTVKLKKCWLKEDNHTDGQVRRGVRTLESAGLVIIRRLPGRNLEVTIVRQPGDPKLW
jgi:hypothetical protein